MSENFVNDLVETLRKRVDRLREEQQAIEMNIRLDPTRRKEMINSIIQYRAGVREAMLTIIKMQNQKKMEASRLPTVNQPLGSQQEPKGESTSSSGRTEREAS